MILTVREAMQLYPLCCGTVAAGKGGLDRIIENINVLEVVESTEFLDANLFAISSLSSIAYDFDKQLSLIHVLIEHKACALMLFNVGVVVPYLSPELLKLCDELDFPLINMPPHISYYEVFSAIIDQLLDHQVQKLQDSIKLYDAYMNQLLDVDDRYSSLLDTLSGTTKHNVMFFSHNQKCVYYTGQESGRNIPPQLVRSIQNNLVHFLDQSDKEYFIQIDGVSYLFMPVTHKHIYYGAIILEDICAPVSDLARLAIDQTCKALCITIFNNERKDEYRKRMRNEFLHDLLLGNYGDKEQIVSQGQSLDLNIADISGILILSPFQYEKRKDTSETFFSEMLDTLYYQTKKIMQNDIVAQFKDLGKVVILTKRKNTVYKKLASTANLLTGIVGSNLETPTIGISPICTDVDMIPICYKKTLNIMEISDRIFEEPRCADYDSLKIYDLLYESIDREKAALIVEQLFAPICTYDSTYNTQLEQTFFSLLINKSTTQVAQDMYLHKNTVLQRKNKISSLYQNDPFSSFEQLQFELGFILKKLFEL